MTRVRPFTRLGQLARWFAVPHPARPVEWRWSAFRKSRETFRFESATKSKTGSGAADRREVRAGRRAGCRWEWRSHGANGCAGRARTMFILQPVPEHPSKGGPGMAGKEAEATSLPRPVHMTGPRTLSLNNQRYGWRPWKGRDEGNRTPYPQITSLMLYPNELHRLEHTAGFEPTTSGSLRRSARLSYMRNPGSSDRRYTGWQCHPRQARPHELDPLPVTGASPGAGV